MSTRTALTLLGVIGVLGFIITTILWFMMYIQRISLYRWFFGIPLVFAVTAVLAISRLRRTS